MNNFPVIILKRTVLRSLVYEADDHPILTHVTNKTLTLDTLLGYIALDWSWGMSLLVKSF